jgi:hypothetical protein
MKVCGVTCFSFALAIFYTSLDFNYAFTHTSALPYDASNPVFEDDDEQIPDYSIYNFNYKTISADQNGPFNTTKPKSSMRRFLLALNYFPLLAAKFYKDPKSK